MEKSVMTWRKCINPIGCKVEHYYDFNLKNKLQIFLYANSICKMCYWKLTQLKHPIVAGYERPEAYKQAGPDSL